MAGKPLILIVPEASMAQATTIADAMACWPAATRPPLKTMSFAQVLDATAQLKQARAAWIFCDCDDVSESDLFEVESIVEEAQTPALLSLRDDHRPLGDVSSGGTVIATPRTPPPVLCAMLRAIWAQSRIIDDLRTEVRFLQAHQGGLCDQMDKIDEELRLAAQLQREFLPTSLPKIGDVEFEVLYRPAGYVSGDIYDVLRLDENHIGFFLGDAVGHGVPAALMTMYIKRSLRTKEVDTTAPRGYRIIPPSEALARLNKDMCDQNEGGRVRFATACYGVINCKTLEIEFSRAGHPFPMILRTDGRVDTIEPEGAMLGVFDEEVYDTVKTTLNKGDRFVIFSDGFECAFPDAPDAPMANRQYETEFKDLLNGPIKMAVQRMEGKLDQQAGSLNQQDDMTIVCLAVKSEAESMPVPAPTVEADLLARAKAI